jgi:hypothetical protein
LESVAVRAAERVPEAAGVKDNPTVQVPLAGRAPVQVVLSIVKLLAANSDSSPAIGFSAMFTPVAPEPVSTVNVSAVLTVPTAAVQYLKVLPKKGEGLHPTGGAGGVKVS